MSIPASSLSASSNSSFSDINISTDATWYSTAQPYMVSITTLNSTIADVDFTIPTISDLLLYTYLGLLGFGIISNTLNLVVISKLKSSVMYIYLHWIAFFELWFCISITPGIVMLHIGATTYYPYAWVNSFFLVPMMLVTSGASMLLTVVIGFDRIYHMRCPLRARLNMTKRRARILVAIVLLICLILRTPFILHLQIHTHRMADGQVMYKGEMVSTSEMSFLVPIFIMALVFDYFSPVSLAVCSAFILYYKRKIRNQRQTLWAMQTYGEHTPAPDSQPTPAVPVNKEKLMMVLVSMSVMSITCNVPVTLLRLSWPVTPEHFLWKNIVNLFYVVDHICNVFIYTAMDRDYWNQLLTLLRPCRPHKTTKPVQHNAADVGNAQRDAKINSSTSINTISL